MIYKPRIVDAQLELHMEAFGAVQIVGPKGCGKTTTAKQKAKSIIEFQNEDERKKYLEIAEEKPSLLLNGKKPILFDEWQDAPKIWGAIRKDVDDTGLSGQYILTGSSSKNIKTPHTGTLRISTLNMYPMSLFESNESDGSVSLKKLFNGEEKDLECTSNLSFDDLVFSICRGGWPRAINLENKKAQLLVAEQFVKQICSDDISHIDSINRNPEWTESIMQSYSRNICQLTDKKSIYSDVSSNRNISYFSFDEYVDALERLHIIEDVPAWNPSIRSRTAIRSGKKRNFVDPSLAVASLGLQPEYFNKDLSTLGFLFESLAIRDLKIYSSNLDGKLSYYHDRYDLEADAVLHLKDGRYAIIEVKLGQKGIEDGAKHLNKLESILIDKTEENKFIRPPDLKIILTATDYGYQRDDGVYIIPIGCLGP